VESHFRKPTTQLFRSYLYLNGDEVINALSALEGGEIDEVLTRSGDEGGGEVRGEINLKVAKGSGAKRKARRYEEEMRKKRTEHSATTALLKRLHEEDAIGILEGDYDESVYQELGESMVIEFTADLQIHPLHQGLAMLRELPSSASAFGLPMAQFSDAREAARLLERLTQGGSSEKKAILAYARSATTPVDYRLLMPIPTRYVLVPLDDFSGKVTIIAQVDRILDDEDELVVVRLIRNAPLLPIERQGLQEGLPAVIEALSDLGLEVTMDDCVLRKPSVILKPICIYK
jgi:hypothetical protein